MKKITQIIKENENNENNENDENNNDNNEMMKWKW